MAKPNRRRPAGPKPGPGPSKPKQAPEPPPAGYGKAALEEPVPTIQEARSMPAAEAESLRRRMLQRMRPPIGRILELGPNYLALRTGNEDFRLGADEREEGVGAFVELLDAICPNLEALLRWLLIGHCLAWTFSMVTPRIILLSKYRRGPRRSRRPAEAPGVPPPPDGSPPGPAPVEGGEAEPEEDDAEGDMD